jgi:hypothetical protein
MGNLEGKRNLSQDFGMGEMIILEYIYIYIYFLKRLGEFRSGSCDSIQG